MENIKYMYVYVMLKISYYLLTKSEVFLEKSQTKTLLYWLNDSEVNTVRLRFEFFLWTERSRLIEVVYYMAFSLGFAGP